MKCPIRIGHPQIDAQHDELFHCIRQLEKIGGMTHRPNRLTKILQDLQMMVSHHFEAEEAVMAELAIPEPIIKIHQDEHQRILLEIAAVIGQTEMDLVAICAQAGNWIDKHLAEFDAPLIQFIEAQHKTQPK